MLRAGPWAAPWVGAGPGGTPKGLGARVAAPPVPGLPRWSRALGRAAVSPGPAMGGQAVWEPGLWPGWVFPPL